MSRNESILPMLVPSGRPTMRYDATGCPLRAETPQGSTKSPPEVFSVQSSSYVLGIHDQEGLPS